MFNQSKLSNIPVELLSYDQWVVHRQKRPLHAVTGHSASATNCSTWTAFETASANASRFDGVGFVLTPDDPYVVIDLDKALDSKGELKPWAEPIVALFPYTYIEQSPSKRGLHIWLKGKKSNRRCKVGKLGIDKIGGLEIYEAERYLTVTGDCFQNAPTVITEGQMALDTLMQEFFPTECQKKAESPRPNLPEDNLIQQLQAHPKWGALWNGQWKGRYPSPSEADYALMGYLKTYSDDPIGVFKQSGLYRALKGEKYLTRTLDNVDTLKSEKTALVTTWQPEDFPPVLAEYCWDEAERMATHPEYIVVSVLTALSIVAGVKCRIQPKAFDTGWIVTPNLWGLVIGSPSTKKTAALGRGTCFLKAIDTRLHQENVQALLAYEQQVMQHKADPESVDLPVKPPLHRLLVNDGTVAALEGVAADNPNGFLVFRDELSGIFSAFSMKGRETDRSFFLEGWNGDSSYRSERVTRGSTYIPNLCLSLLGGIQPERLEQFIRKQRLGEDGFLQRFQLLAYPSPRRFKRVDREPNLEASKRVQAIFDAVHAIKDQRLFRFSPAAQQDFDEFQDHLPDEPGSLGAYLSKTPKLVASLAVIFQLMVAPSATVISQYAVRAALCLNELLEDHARRLYKKPRQKTLLEKKRTELNVPFTPREVSRKKWSGLTDTYKVRAAIQDLVELNVLTKVSRYRYFWSESNELA